MDSSPDAKQFEEGVPKASTQLIKRTDALITRAAETKLHRAETSTVSKSQARRREKDRVEKAKSGDLKALESLLSDNERKLYGVALGILKHPENARDAVQETMIKAYRKLDAFEGKSAFSTWVYRICFNTCLDMRRSLKRKSASSYESILESSPQVIEKKVLDERGPEAAILGGELKSKLNDALNSLSEAHREIIVLREAESLSYDEIGERLGIRRGTVMSRLFHARKKLADFLTTYESGESDPEAE